MLLFRSNITDHIHMDPNMMILIIIQSFNVVFHERKCMFKGKGTIRLKLHLILNQRFILNLSGRIGKIIELQGNWQQN